MGFNRWTTEASSFSGTVVAGHSKVACRDMKHAWYPADPMRLLNHELELIEETQAGVNHIIKHGLPGPITCLPPSVLSDIIYRASCVRRTPLHKERAGQRRWRYAILNCPQLWTTIVIDPSWSSSSLVMAHVTRSGACLLDITITKWSSVNHAPQFRQLLGLLVTCGYRWLSLDISKEFVRAWVHAFQDFTNKFATVRRLRLLDTTDSPPLHLWQMWRMHRRSFFAKVDTPADHWKDLTELTIKGLMVRQIRQKDPEWSIKESRDGTMLHLYENGFVGFTWSGLRAKWAVP
ncbi:hypothetical protein EDD15DRAFT_2362447 [Pisolithus albus]|nr:hypothetical protein EDD15DRAFT_2362447 [Pisolithus albus]